MPTPCLALFTKRGAWQILEEGGSGDWVLDANRARRCRFAVCIRNIEGHLQEDHRTGEPYVPHGTAFLVGEIVDVVLVDGEAKPARWLVKFGRYVDVSHDGVWDGRRNPVGYMTMEDFGIDPALLDFRRMPGLVEDSKGATLADPYATAGSNVRPLTLAQAKEGLALYLGVDEGAIEIIVRA